MSSVSWAILPGIPLMTLRGSDCELHLTFKGEGPGSDLTSTETTESGGQGRRAWGVVGGCLWLKLL